MDKISSMMFHNCQSEKDNVDNDNLASNHEDCEMSTTPTLKKITSLLFEENINENTSVSKDALQAVERSFYDILGQKYSPSTSDLQQSSVPQMYPNITNQIQNESIPILEFKRGIEEGMKFLPNIENNRSTVDLQANKIWFHLERKNDSDLVKREIKGGEKEKNNSMMPKGKRHVNSRELSLVEGRKCKIFVLHYKSREEEFNKVFLLHENNFAKEALRLRVIMLNVTKLCNKKGIHENFVDLRTLLIHCSEAIAINDIENANLLIKRIKNHSSPYGDSVQRMAYILVNGLEARLNGTTIERYKHLVPRESLTDFLNCFHMYLVSCPTLMVSQYFANYTILNAIRKASKVHIINLGVEFGFNWPTLIYELSTRIGGPPKLRITNIENLEASYLPAEQIQVAWQSLNYLSRSFGVPLEYRALKIKWDKIRTHDLNIEKDEVVIVNCYHGFEYLYETDVMNNPKNRALDIVRQIKPHIFVHSIINGSFTSSYFVDRFKQVLLYTSAMFDFFDATMPHNNKDRWFLENVIWGPTAFNLIACEGSKRCVGAETYKQWHTRNSRVGFEQLSLDHAILKKIKDKVREVYHKDFFIGDDKDWLLLGWKGRVMSAVSAWYPRQI